jgi:zinc finger CCHC domain-containing protein 9
MGRKTYEQATPYDRHMTTAEAPSASGPKRAPLQPQDEVEASLGFKKERSEARRQRRERERNSGKVCFACRKEGHRIQDCQETDAAGAAVSSKSNRPGGGAASICYRCGKSDHALKQCRLHPSKGLPFARCFVCKEQGHITSNCPTNSRGVYPSGGCCKICRSVEHLAKDCPLPDEVRLGTVIGLQSIEGSNAIPLGGADDDDFHDMARVENRKRPGPAALPRAEPSQASKPVAAHKVVAKTSKKVVSF